MAISCTAVTIIDDSYMGMILPENISERIAAFVDCKQSFPYIESKELTCIFFLYGRRKKVISSEEYEEAIDLARQTFAKISKEITARSNSEQKVDADFIRSSYINRGLQIAIEKQHDGMVDDKRIFTDPIILSDCFCRHTAYYKQEFFFQVYGPFKNSDITSDTSKHLLGRMVMIGYNRKDERSLPYNHPLLPLYVWIRQFM
jgi:hypothetical protein